MKPTLLAAGAVCLATMAGAQTRVLNVYTYDSFTSEWGPGPAIEAGFEAVCACDLQFQTAGDGASLLARLQLEGASTPADVVVGLDTNLAESARNSGLFAPVSPAQTNLPIDFSDPNFVPFDWGWFGFVYDKTKLASPPTSLQELAASDVKIIIQDPRSSTPGLGLVMWVAAAYGDQGAQIWADLADNIVTVTPGWSEAYSMFLEGEADMVLSYTTSPAYHLIAEQDDTKAAALFTEGHYLQIELAGKVAGTDQPQLADQFLTYLLGDGAQETLITTNWMYPAKTPSSGLPAGFETLIQPTKSLIIAPAEAEAMRAKLVAEWQNALAK
jgi:thiamine transport system substrate-binding protein